MNNEQAKAEAEKIKEMFYFGLPRALGSERRIIISKTMSIIHVKGIIEVCKPIVQSNDCAPYYDESHWQSILTHLQSM